MTAADMSNKSVPEAQADCGKVLCVTGMHRSGTSLITSWIETSGFQVHDGRLMEATKSNVRGHFEDRDFVALHQGAINRTVANARGWQVTKPRWLEFTAEERERAKQLIAERHAKYEMWAWKDPRTVMFLPQWKALIPSLRVLLLWRPCADVVRSLVTRSAEAREGSKSVIGVWRAAMVWRAHNLLVLEFKRRFADDTLLLPINSVVEDPQCLSTGLGALMGREPEGQLDDVLDPALFKMDCASRLHRIAARLAGAPRIERALAEGSNVRGSVGSHVGR